MTFHLTTEILVPETTIRQQSATLRLNALLIKQCKQLTVNHFNRFVSVFMGIITDFMAADRYLCSCFVLQPNDWNKCPRYQRVCLPCLYLLHTFGKHIQSRSLANLLQKDILASGWNKSCCLDGRYSNSPHVRFVCCYFGERRKRGWRLISCY